MKPVKSTGIDLIENQNHIESSEQFKAHKACEAYNLPLGRQNTNSPRVLMKLLFNRFHPFDTFLYFSQHVLDTDILILLNKSSNSKTKTALKKKYL